MGHCGGCASANERCGNGLEKIYPTTAVRYGRMKHIGEFSHPPDMRFSCGAKVVIATDRGIELGEQVSLTCFGCDRSVSRDQMRAYAEASGGEAYQLKRGRILREATEPDLAEWRHIQAANFEKLQISRRASDGLDLPMKIIDCEQIFGGERIILYFLAEERIDFREMVRMLAAEFQTRIEMRQIGARDEARLLADYETCGRECCCKSFLKTLKPISMQMAKLQKATLDPSKVSGRCGRLKCCLRYEHETYEDLDRRLPRLGVWVATNQGRGQVIDRQVLTQLIKIRGEDERVVSVVAEDILEVNIAPPPPPEARTERPSGGPDRRPFERSRPNGGRPGERRPGRREPDPRAGQPLRDSGGPADPGREPPPEPRAANEEADAGADSEPMEPDAGAEPSAGGPASGEKPGEVEQSPDRARRFRRRRRRRNRDGGPRGGASGPQ